MAPKYFTVEQANAILPEVRPLMAELLERRAKVVRTRRETIEMIRGADSDFGGRIPSELVREFIRIERLAKQIRGYGCIIRDINTGLLDFLAEREGREVFLCWRFNEPRVAFYHDLHTGFQGRQPL